MSLYGALFSGVSGLSAQSSAMGAIADNVTNVNTIGYKSTQVQFQTLVTRQVSLTQYSAGGVQSKPRQGVDVQGLLQATTSSTDVALSGQGFFVVSDQANTDTGSQFGYTRAGSFKIDKDGFLRNTSGWYLQGWPLQPAGQNTDGFVTVTSGGDEYIKAYNDENGNTVAIDDNIVTSEDLQPLNLNTIGGTAQETKNIRFGANLPSGADVGDQHKSNLLIYDTLGNSHQLTTYFDKTDANSWSMDLAIPPGAATLELHGDTEMGDAAGVYAAYGQLEFESMPADGDTFVIDGITFEFDTATSAELVRIEASGASTYEIDATGSATSDTIRGAAGAFSDFSVGDTITLSGTDNAANAGTYTITGVNADGSELTFAEGTFAGDTAADDSVVFTAAETQTRRRLDISTTTDVSDVAAIVVNAIGRSNLRGHSRFEAVGGRVQITQSAMGDAINLDVSGTNVITQRNANGETGVFTVEAIDPNYTNGARFDFDGVPSDGDTITLDGITFEFDTQPASFPASTGNAYAIAAPAPASPGAGSLQTITGAFGTFNGIRVGEEIQVGNSATAGNNGKTFTVTAISADGSQITIDTATDSLAATGPGANDQTIELTLFNGGAGDTATRRRVDISGAGRTIESVTTALKAAIDGSSIDQPSRFSADGTSLTFEQSANGGAVSMAFDTTTSGSDVISGYRSNMNNDTDFEDDSLDTMTNGATAVTVDASDYGVRKAGIAFNGDGTPEYINVNNIDIQWANGAQDQESGSAEDTRIGLFLGNKNISDGMTQFAGSFQINYVSQNGASFGNFSGVSIGNDGVVTALFDNGVTRPVFMIPVATFVNPNQMDNLSGNVWIETDFSGQPTVREAQEGGAGEVAGGSLESSTVDLGEEFTSMITTQRAYSAAAKIISTSDEMLEELMRVKR